ncbi:MAG: T9SS type A sorting domain-containing protein [Fibrobacter sp.]|nr:T9SS type A sorting domain-containing protein [Fibrobacter sp.]
MNMKVKMAMGVIVAAALANADCGGDGTVNTSIWFDGSDPWLLVENLILYDNGDCEENSVSYWYDYDDRKNDDGGSYALYPFKADEYGSLVGPEIENLGYATIKYVLVDPTITGQTDKNPYNFVGFGFNTTSHSSESLNISAAEGLCATYTSDHDVTLEVAAEASGDASCFVTLPKATVPTMVDKAIDDFKQPTWASAENKLASCADAFKAAKAVKFQVNGAGADLTGTLRVFEVGPKGTCTGEGAISPNEPENSGCKSDGDGDAVCDISLAFVGSAAVAAISSVKATLSGRTLSFSGISSDASFEIVSLQGQVVKSGKIASSVSLASINAGVYMVRVVGRSVNMAQKILVK